MSLITHTSFFRNRRSVSALVLTGAGLAGIAGCALNMSPGEKIVATAEAETKTETPVQRSALSRLLKKPAQEETVEDSLEQTATSSTTIGRGRLFSAIVDRFPLRKKDTVDPFLEAEIEAERYRARLVEKEDDRPRSDSDRSRSALAQSQPRVRTDEQLWELFDDDAAANVRTRPDPTLASRNSAARPFPAEVTPAAEKPEEPPAAQRRSGAAVAALPASRAEAVENPFAKFLSERDTENDEPSVADAARAELDDLLSPSGRHDARSSSHIAGGPTASGTGVSRRSPFETADVPQTTAAHRQVTAPVSDPFGSGPTEGAAVAAQGMSPFASGSSIGSALPWTTRVQPAKTFKAGTGAQEAVASAIPPFPATPEWQSVRANSPVSLAGIEQAEPMAAAVEPSAVRHALVHETPAPRTTPSQLLPRQLPAQTAFDPTSESLAFNSSPALEGPLLAPPIATKPVLVAPAPVLIAADEAASELPLAAADEELARSGGFGGWLLGAGMLAVGLWLFAFRTRQPMRRHATTAQK